MLRFVDNHNTAEYGWNCTLPLFPPFAARL